MAKCLQYTETTAQANFLFEIILEICTIENMTTLRSKANKVLTDAERGIATLANDAVAQGDYQTATLLLQIAQKISESNKLFLDSDESTVKTRELDTKPKNSSREVLVAPSSHEFDDEPTLEKAYPRFVREGESIVKIGWSKADKAEYEHRSPTSVLQCLVKKIRLICRLEERFTTEQLMPLKDEDGEELPSYQSYLCLAWLVAIHVLEKHGRQGYTIRSAIEFEKAVTANWEKMTRR